MTDFTKIPGIIMGFLMTREGDFRNTDKKPMKVSVKLTGCKVRLGRRTFSVSELWRKTFGASQTELKDIVALLEDVSWIRTQRLMWKVFDDHVKVKVLYQGGGVMETDRFELSHLVDALLIFQEGGVFHNKWARAWSPPRKRF